MKHFRFVFPVSLMIVLLVYLLTTILPNGRQLPNTGTRVASRHTHAHKEQHVDHVGAKEVKLRNFVDTSSRNNLIEQTAIARSDNKKERESVSVNTKTNGGRRTNISNEVTHIEFLKVHKAASSTVQSVLMRFGLKRNLSFVIPATGNYISTQKTYFIDLWPPLPKEKNIDSDHRNKYDVLCHHMVFNRKKVSRLLHNDSVFIGIVREPFDQFLSSAIYYKYKWKYPYLDKLPNETFITDLIRNPHQYEATTMSESMTYNSMSYDFGLGFGTLKSAKNVSQDQFDDFLKETAKVFDIVMLFEKFDESLVLLRRYLNWTFEDILYTKINSFSIGHTTNIFKMFQITTNDTILFEERNKFDYGLYDFFKDRLEKQIAKETLFTEEVNHFKRIQREVQDFCNEQKTEKVHTTTARPKMNVPDSEKMSRNIKTSKEKKIRKDIKKERRMKLVKVINATTTEKVMTERQASELRKLVDLHIKEPYEWPVNDLITMIPLLFDEKSKEEGDRMRRSDLLVPKSKWNKAFFVTSSDCKLMTMDEPTLFTEVKKHHLKVLVQRKFGDNFSVIEAVRHILTFY